MNARGGVNNYLILQYAKLIFGLYQAAASRRRGQSSNFVGREHAVADHRTVVGHTWHRSG